ncbi:MAG: VWA domain-containing protein [Pyrinomonadaceae bacterium]
MTKDFTVGARPQIALENRFGQVRIETDEKLENKVLLEAVSPSGKVADNEITVIATPVTILIVVNQTKKRIDLTLRVPGRSRLKILGAGGEIEVTGNFESAEISSDTGTIYADVPIDKLKFDFLWTESRPRYLSDFEIPEPKEKAGGKFEIAGKIPDKKSPKSKVQSPKSEEMSDKTPLDDENSENKNQKPKTKNQKPNDTVISLKFTTKRGVILLNVPPSQVPSDLRERPLTNAAKAIVRSGDSILSEAIRRAAPKYFGDYIQSLPARRATPNIISRQTPENTAPQVDVLRRVNLSVADSNGRAINNLKAEDFALLENNEAREIISVEPTTAPFNLVLLLDVSGSVEERIDFIRKAARNFVNTVSEHDELAIITIRDDVQVVSNFTVDKNSLSESLDIFDAGGGTALYDGLAFVLADTLRPLKGERTAIVILSDGDDNRSFIPFEPLLGAIQESGALVYPLYVPSGLIPINGQPNATGTLDPVRTRFMSLTTKAEEEAKQLAEVSGGVYFPIKRLEDLQNAYEDVVAQLRTAYSVTYRSKTAATPRLRIQVKRAGGGAFVRSGNPVEVQN